MPVKAFLFSAGLKKMWKTIKGTSFQWAKKINHLISEFSLSRNPNTIYNKRDNSTY
jgi:hypothetical protein